MEKRYVSQVASSVFIINAVSPKPLLIQQRLAFFPAQRSWMINILYAGLKYACIPPGTGATSAATIGALQNTLVLALNTPGWTAQLVSSVTSSLALASATTGLNPATLATITAIQALAATGTGNTVGNTVTGSVSSSSSSSAGCCASGAITLPSLQPQFLVYLTALKQSLGGVVSSSSSSSSSSSYYGSSSSYGSPSSGSPSSGSSGSSVSTNLLASLEAFITSFELAPILSPQSSATLGSILNTIATSGVGSTLLLSTQNLQAGLAAYNNYTANCNTVQLLQTLYQLSATNPNLDPNVFGGLGALVAQTAGLSSVPVGTPPTLLVQVREATRYVAQSYQTPLPQLILAKIINCRVTPACCRAGSAASSTPAASASSSTPASSASSSSGSQATYGQSYSGYVAPSYSSSPAMASSSNSNSGYGSSSGSSSSSPSSSSSSSYGSPSSSSGYGSSGSSSAASQVNNAAVLGVNQSAPVYSAQNYTANQFPAFLPVYPVLQSASSSSGGSSGYGSSVRVYFFSLANWKVFTLWCNRFCVWSVVERRLQQPCHLHPGQQRQRLQLRLSDRPATVPGAALLRAGPSPFSRPTLLLDRFSLLPS